MVGRTIAVACIVICILAPSVADDSTSSDISTKSTTATETARGVVFDDRNANEKRDEGEPGLPGVGVSNGREIVETDAQGRYELTVDNDDIVFVIKPRDWMVKLGRNNLPDFYYIHKPAGSPASFKYPGVSPTGPLPASIDFALHKRPEPEQFKALMFGDPQPRNIQEVEYIAHDTIEQVIRENAHDAAFGVNLGDIAFDDLTVMEPLNQAIALIGIPWYNVIGNHDLNMDAQSDDLSDETFERIYGPAYYSFDHGPAHFLVLDDVDWHAATEAQRAHYEAGLGARQMEFIRNDLARIPTEQLVVLMMHIPLTGVADRQELYRLIEKRPATVSISAHTHYMEHRMIGEEDGWMGAEKHHHIVNVTVCGSWFRGQKDEAGIPHATMSDGGPNGYSIMEFNGAEYSLEVRPSRRPAAHQMNLYAPESIKTWELATTALLANVFNGKPSTRVSMQVDQQGSWIPMDRIVTVDPAYIAEKAREDAIPDLPWRSLPGAHATPHMWRAFLPTDLGTGTHMIEVKAVQENGAEYIGRRIIRVES